MTHRGLGNNRYIHNKYQKPHAEKFLERYIEVTKQPLELTTLVTVHYLQRVGQGIIFLRKAKGSLQQLQGT